MAPVFLARAMALGAAALSASHAPAPTSVRHLRSVLPLEGLVLDWAAADVDGDGVSDLLVARRMPDGQRVMHVFKMRPDGVLPTQPDHVVEIKRDIVSWGVGEFRPDDPGVELLFTTRSGAYTLSPRKQSYRDNIDGFLKADLLLDLASDRALPRWETIADVDGDGIDEVALATSTGFVVARVDGEVLGRINVALSRSIRPAPGCSGSTRCRATSARTRRREAFWSGSCSARGPKPSWRAIPRAAMPARSRRPA